jgi:hypothetical protein
MNTSNNNMITLSYIGVEDKDGETIHKFKSLGVLKSFINIKYEDNSIFPINSICKLTKVVEGNFPPTFNDIHNSIYIINGKKVKIVACFEAIISNKSISEENEIIVEEYN